MSCISKYFSFPSKVLLDIGWKLWLVGLTGYETVDSDGIKKPAPICLFCLLRPKLIPTKIRDVFCLK